MCPNVLSSLLFFGHDPLVTGRVTGTGVIPRWRVPVSFFVVVGWQCDLSSVVSGRPSEDVPGAPDSIFGLFARLHIGYLFLLDEIKVGASLTAQLQWWWQPA